MLFPGFEGPKEQWRAELDRVNKYGLLAFIDTTMMHLDALTGGMNRESLLKTVRLSKKYGKWNSEQTRFMKYKENPRKYIAEAERRRVSAKRAARRRKRGR